MRNKGLLVGIGSLIILAAGAAALAEIGKDTKPVETHQSSETRSQQNTQAADRQEQASPSSQAVATTEVEIEDYAYVPSTITVKVGQTVTWTNKDTVRHDVKADNPSSDAPSSELLAKGESYSFTFNKAGTYSYFCSPHPYMKGTVVVTE